MSIVIVGGGMRTGSVAMYQVMRDIVEWDGGTAPPLSEKLTKDDVARWVRDGETAIRKLHMWHSALEGNEDHVMVVIGIRDYRDVVASHMRFRGDKTFKDFKGSRAYLGNIRSFYEWFEKVPGDNILVVKYEDYIEDTKRIVREICDFLSIDIDGRSLAKIVDRWSLERNKKRATQNKDLNDREFMSPRHIYKAVPGYHTQDLSPEEIKTIENDAGEWMREVGYLEEEE